MLKRLLALILMATLPIYEIFAPAPRVLLKRRRAAQNGGSARTRPVTSL